MSFLQPLLLWALPALLLPVLVHLWHRRRHRTIPWAAMQFLREAVQQTRGRHRLRHFLILACRMLAVAALIFAIARPLADGGSGLSFFSAPHRFYVLPDTSPSMRMHLQDGKSLASAAFERLRLSAKERDYPNATFLFADEKPISVTRNWESVRSHATKLLGASTDIPGLLERVLRQINEDEQAQREIWIASDLHSSDWKPKDERWQEIRDQLSAQPDRSLIRLFAMDPGPTKNAGLHLISVRRIQGGALRLTLEIYQSEASGDQTVPVEIHHGDNQNSLDVKLTGALTEWTHDIKIPDTQGWGSIALAPDANPADNTVYFVYPQRETPPVLLIGTKGFAMSVVSLAARKNLADTVTPVREISPLDVIENLPWTGIITLSAPRESIKTLNDYIVNGGEVLSFADDQPTKVPLPDDLGFEALRAAADDRFFTLKEWMRTDGLLADTASGTALALDRLLIKKFRPVATTQGVALARLSDGLPLIVHRPLGKGSFTLVGTRPDDTWSNLADGPVLLPIIQRFLERQLARRTASLISLAGGPTNERYSSAVPVAGAEPGANPLWSIGVYRSDDSLFAINRPASENIEDRLEETSIQSLFGNVPVELVAAGATDPRWKLSAEIWRFFVVSLLLFLFIETVLSLPLRRSTATARTS